jgi:hypothetical protein
MNDATAIFHRAILSRRDFQQTVHFLQEVRTERTRIENDAFLIAAVISYARPFSPNERDPQPMAVSRLTINPESVLSPEQLAVHRKVILLRNKVVAHAEFATDPVGLLDAQPDGMTLSGPYLEIKDEVDDVRPFLSVAQTMQAECMNLMFRLKDAVTLTTRRRVAHTRRNPERSA